MILHGSEAGGGPPVVLLHGLFGMARNLGVLQRGLAQRFRVIALDLRNHGASPHASDMRYPTLAADVAETLAARDALPAAVIGHSMGGKTAMMLALTCPEAVRRLVVADVAPVRYPARNAPFIRALRGVPLTPGLTRAQADAALAGSVADPAPRAFLLQNLAFGVRPGWRIALDAIEAALPGLEGWDAPDAARFEGPTLFVAGERSDFIRAEYRDTIRSLFPTARLVTVKNAGHWLHADSPSGVLSVLEAFLQPWEAAGPG
jgi:esterase